MKSRFLYFLAAEVTLCLLLIVIWPSFPIDDSYIFLTYARNLAKSGLFAFNPGEVSYGFSSPAYVILLASASRLTGIPVGVALSNILGVLMCGSATTAVWSLWGEIDERPSNREMLLTAILLSGPWFFTVWFIYGMETGLAVLSLLGFLLWLVKLRAGAPRFHWLLVGIIATSVLATTRLESGIFIACGIIIALTTSRSRREIRDLTIVAMLSAGTEIAWLLYAKRTFGTYLPWTSTARLLYYLPGHFGLESAAQFYRLGVAGRGIIALKAAAALVFGGPLKFLLIFVPIFAGVFFLWARRKPSSLKQGKPALLKWILQVAVLGMVLEMIAFACLFPLVQNRHLAPYIAGIWVLVSLPIARAASRMRPDVQAAVIVAVVVLWIGGAIQYRSSGTRLETLHRLAASGHILPTDKLAAEPIGILSFETQARIIDLGGLTDRSAWTPLMQEQRGSPNNIAVWRDIVAWGIGKGATKLLLKDEDCGAQGLIDNCCLVDASAAATLTLR